MKNVLNPHAPSRLGALLAECQQRVRRHGRRIPVDTICRQLQISSKTFYALR